MKKKTKKQRKLILLLRKLAACSFLGILLIFAISELSFHVGDSAFEKEKLTQAQIWYTISKFTNPFHPGIDKRLMATKVELHEHTIDSEETSDASRYLAYNTGKAVLGATSGIKVPPILMYHYIRINPYPTDTKGFDLSVTPYNFDQQMKWLKEAGYTTITPDELGRAILYNRPLTAPHPILLTLDDGYADAYTDAFPILQKYGLKATAFIILNFLELPRYLTWDEMAEMQRSSIISFQSHTMNHAGLTGISDTSMKNELVESRKVLGQFTKSPINWIAYPFGLVNQHVSNTTYTSGYFGAFGTDKFRFHDDTHPCMTLWRIRIGGGDSLESFKEKIQDAEQNPQVVSCK